MIDVSTAATLACIWEATAAKPGNVYRGADFEDATYADFLASAALIGPILARSGEQGVGQSVLECIQTIRESVGTNTYLGTILLLAPLAAISPNAALADGLPAILRSLSASDTRLVYEAIRLASPGGLGSVEEADVHQQAPDLPLVAVMQLAAERDLVARQFTNNFEQVFWVADRITQARGPLSQRIVRGYLQLLAEHPDSLISRKCALTTSQEVSQYAARVLSCDDKEYEDAVADFDFWLRADGHRRNPGTSADIVAAALFVLLREGRIEWPVKFY